MVKPEIKPKVKFRVERIFTNSKNGQMSITLPKKKMKNIVPTKIEVSFW